MRITCELAYIVVRTNDKVTDTELEALQEIYDCDVGRGAQPTELQLTVPDIYEDDVNQFVVNVAGALNDMRAYPDEDLSVRDTCR